ncbi:putative YigZ family protein [Humibacillus xanthopallidus]|uniref:Putative YigZ family protein n=1 Tax=Humibacillus xanthopallidus TaxID=412689 RepID=A0A543PY29_9MICO|nr:YigZ family protein [Humibacillus xanthopallidus]TQN48983.1 putative YigZ family protein [Humibacillus xanthopallidus]
MPTPNHYVTLAAPARSEVEVRRSRFVCDVRPVSSEAEARAAVEQVRSSSRDARHHCTAFVLGPEGATTRSNDDGEPSGTAGAPMLDVLRGRGLTDVVAVVTRWFGGTLLGTGGLIRAYGDAVSLALDDASLVRMELREGLVVEVDHAVGPRLEHALRGRAGVEVMAVDYLSRGVRLHVAAAPGAVGDVERTVAVLASGTGSVTAGDPSWVPSDIDAPEGPDGPRGAGLDEAT